jgi:hypothetical protein
MMLTLVSLNSVGQNKLPTNLKQAIKYLDKDCPEKVKTKIKTIREDSLIYVVYPFAKDEPYRNYETVFRWTSNENANPAITKYLERRKIFDYHSEILLYAFRQHLLNKEIDKKEIISKFKKKQIGLDERNKVRHLVDTINGVYIPKNLEDCFAQINSFWNDSTKLKVKDLEEEEFIGRAHIGFGMWMRNNWQLWGGSRLSKYFNDFEIHHPDEMSCIILVSYHRYLNNKEIKIEEQIKQHDDHLENSEKAVLLSKQKEFSEYHIGDTLQFKYSKGYVSKEQEDKDNNGSCIAKGVLIERNEKDFLIKVKVIQSCDRKGIIYYDNDGYRIYNPKTKRWSNPPKRVIKRTKRNKQRWFEYKDWETS